MEVSIMCAVKTNSALENQVQDFVKKGFKPHFDELKDNFAAKPQWQKLRELGTELWLDSGNIEDIEQQWTREFSALTVNNTLLNKEIQAGRYDSLIPEIMNLLDAHPDLTQRRKILEINFILNAYHGLRLVEKFDAHVSLEEHTDLADGIEQAIYYARRFHAICPERFYVKIPFTAAGLLATRKLSSEKIPVNHTLGFSARQNYVITRIAGPAYVNVFLGRLNSFVADNDLGTGDYVGEKATLASQKAVKELRAENLTQSRQIGASFRNGQQVHSLAGIDVMTMPPKVAGEFLKMDIPPDRIEDRTEWKYSHDIKQAVDPRAIRLDTLWTVDQKLISCADKLQKENLDGFTPQDLSEFFKSHGCPDIFVDWDESQIQASYKEGKIPRLANWKDALESRTIGLDCLMNLAGLNSFRADQAAMDERLTQLINQNKKQRT
jgi:transaldolase